VQTIDRPGESWAQARKRLEAANFACPPAPVDDHPGADYTLAGPVDECEGLDGQPIQWAPGELGRASNSINNRKGTPAMLMIQIEQEQRGIGHAKKAKYWERPVSGLD